MNDLPTDDEVFAIQADVDPMVILQDALGTMPELMPSEVLSAGLPEIPSEQENEDIPIEELRKQIEIEEETYFPIFQKAAVLDARLKILKQQFEKDNAELIASVRVAIAKREDASKVLKALAVVYGKRTGEKQFDQYIGFRENRVISWDEPGAIAWLEQNFPAALIKAGVTIDAGRFKTYITDCLKKKQQLPPSVTVTTEWETTISSKIPVPELESIFDHDA
jgi:hypothetical protein